MKAEELKDIAEKRKARNLEETIKEIERRMVINGEFGINYIKITTDKYSDYLYGIDKWMVKPIVEHFRSNGFKVDIKGEKELFGWLERLLDVYDPNEIITITWEV